MSQPVRKKLKLSKPQKHFEKKDPLLVETQDELLYEFPREIVEMMLQYVHHHLYMVIMGEWEKIPRGYVYGWAIQFNCFPLLRWARDPDKKGGVIPWDHKIMYYVGLHNNREMLRWINDLPHPTPHGISQLVDGAAAGGHIDFLEWCSDQKSYWFEPTAVKEAVVNGHIRTFQWLRTVKPYHAGVAHCSLTPLPRENLFELALRYSHFEMFHYIRNNEEFQSDYYKKQLAGALLSAFRQGNVEIIRICLEAYRKYGLPDSF
jgi:hypothetical protein